MNYYPELTELAEVALNKILPRHDNLVVTKGLLIAEILANTDDHRSVIAVQFGRQGVIPPYDIIGLLRPVEMSAEARIAGAMGWHDEEGDHQ